MPKSKEPPSLQKFAIKPPPMESLETETPPTQQNAPARKMSASSYPCASIGKIGINSMILPTVRAQACKSSWLPLLRTICRRMESNLLPDDNTMTS